MTPITIHPLAVSQLHRRAFNLFSLAAALLVFISLTLAPAFAVEIPTDDEQDVLVRSTLMTFNDANMTNNYSILLAKASKQFQAQFTAERLSNSFEPLRVSGLFFESAVTDDYDSQEKASIDSDGALVLAGVIKGEEVQVKYSMRFIQNGTQWKLLGINVNVKKV
jgi:hypothetical protein